MPQKPRPSILLVDDDPDICQNLSDILMDLDYSVDVAHDGFEALRLVDGKLYDLALLDLKMPGMDGLTLYREIKQRSTGTVAIIVTAFAGPTTTADALAAGAWDVMAKPVDFSRLLRSLDEALERPLLLVVDDDRELCSGLWDVLREEGYRAHLAHDASEAAEHLTSHEFQVVLIDLKLPDADGGTIFTMVRRESPETRTVLITAHQPVFEHRIAEILAEGADAVCYKPFDIQGLLQTLGRLVS